MILILTKDLMMSSSANAAAKPSGVSVKSIPSSSKLVEMLEAEDFKLVLIDLQMPGLDLKDLESRMRGLGESRPKTIAYAQHVNVDMITRAKEMPFDQVMTRGQLTSKLPELMASTVDQ